VGLGAGGNEKVPVIGVFRIPLSPASESECRGRHSPRRLESPDRPIVLLFYLPRGLAPLPTAAESRPPPGRLGPDPDAPITCGIRPPPPHPYASPNKRGREHRSGTCCRSSY